VLRSEDHNRDEGVFYSVAEAVLETYVVARQHSGGPRSPLGRLILDNGDGDGDEPTSPRTRNINLPAIAAVEYRCDVEKAFSNILATHPALRPALDVLLKEHGLPIQTDQTPSAHEKALMLSKLGRLALAWQLGPSAYFTKVRR